MQIFMCSFFKTKTSKEFNQIKIHAFLYFQNSKYSGIGILRYSHKANNHAYKAENTG